MDNQHLEANCRMIADELNKSSAAADMNKLCEKLFRINSLIALSAECLRQARQNLLYRQAQLLKQNHDNKLQASVLIKMIQSECWQEDAMLTWAERLNAGLVHAGEHIRTVIAWKKAEMQNQAAG